MLRVKDKQALGSNHAVLYTRVSSKEQEKEGFSIPAQQKLLREYAAKQGMRVACEFTDVETAKTAGRTQFGKMVEYLKAHPDIRIILVEKTDRLYRNFRDYILLEDLNIEIHLVKENEIISKDSRSHAKFIHGIKVLMAKNYIDNLSEEVKKGLREKAEQGEWPSQAPLGYVNNKTTHLIEIDPERAILIRRLFELYVTGGYSLLSVRGAIDSAGLKTRTGKKLAKSSVEMILKNPFYCGDFVWRGQHYRGNHNPLITRELFDKVQTVLHRSNKSKPHKHHFAFTGLLQCAKCGCRITAEMHKARYVYYRCTGGRGKCDQPYIREEILDKKLSTVLNAIRIDENISNWILQALRESHSEEKMFRETVLKRLNRRHADLQGRIDKAYEDRLDGVIDEAYWRDVSAKWRTEQSMVRGQIERFQHANQDYLEQGTKILELAQNAYSLYLRQDLSEKRRLLDCVLSNCSIDGLTIYPTYKKPFDLIVEGLKTIKKLPRLDLNQRPAD